MPDANNLVPLVASARFSVRAAAGLMLAAAVFAVSPARAQPTEPVVVRTVTQDDQVRIEETRVRGAVQRIVVEQKVGGSFTTIAEVGIYTNGFAVGWRGNTKVAVVDEFDDLNEG